MKVPRLVLPLSVLLLVTTAPSQAALVDRLVFFGPGHLDDGVATSQIGFPNAE